MNDVGVIPVDAMADLGLQPLDNKVLNRLEAAVSKSPYAQGKKLKVVPKVRRCPATEPSHLYQLETDPIV